MARIGTGGETAPYGIGSRHAAASASKQAQAELSERLRHECELVPCPKCDWINESLVSGYRRGCYRVLAKSAVPVGIIGAVCSLIGARYISIGPEADRGALPYFLLLGPLLWALLATFMLLLCRWLRSRIRPNRNYPLPPKLPLGSPKPLIKDASTGQFKVAEITRHGVAEGETWVDFQIGRCHLPSLCCECLDIPDPASAYRYPVSQAVDLAFPLCSRCACRWKRRSRLINLSCSAVIITLGLPLLMMLQLDEAEFWIFFGGLCCIAPLFGALISYRSTTPVRVKGADYARGVVRLWFRNEDYRRRVLMADREA